jgi:hypothetical protein
VNSVVRDSCGWDATAAAAIRKVQSIERGKDGVGTEPR